MIQFWRDHGTKVLGSSQAVISGFIAISGLIPPENVKYWLAANVVIGAMTVQRGFTNTRNAQEPK